MNTEGIAIESSGDPETDRQRIAHYIKSTERIEDGVCPNGCARLTVLSPHTRECPACGFFYGQSTCPSMFEP